MLKNSEPLSMEQFNAFYVLFGAGGAFAQTYAFGQKNQLYDEIQTYIDTKIKLSK